jgi:hypothetical protein
MCFQIKRACSNAALDYCGGVCAMAMYEAARDVLTAVNEHGAALFASKCGRVVHVCVVGGVRVFASCVDCWCSTGVRHMLRASQG